LLCLIFVGAVFASDFSVVNSCKTALWIEARGGSGPIPGQSNTVTRLNPGQDVNYTMPEGGLASTRFWAKYGCNDQGRECLIGDQDQYWPGGGCPGGGCTPPIDSLFEATWGCKSGNCDKTTWFDTSQVDGYTIPYIVRLYGNTAACDNGRGLKVLDATHVDLSKCPTNEDISARGAYPTLNWNGKSINLRSVDLKYTAKNGQVVGCASPCSQMSHIYDQNPGSLPTIYYCCPTPNPNNCQISQGCITSQECRAGPVATARYTNATHQMTGGTIYAYAYDDGVGLHTCPAGTVTYVMEFCPPGSPAYPQ